MVAPKSNGFSLMRRSAKKGIRQKVTRLLIDPCSPVVKRVFFAFQLQMVQVSSSLASARKRMSASVGRSMACFHKMRSYAAAPRATRNGPQRPMSETNTPRSARSKKTMSAIHARAIREGKSSVFKKCQH